MVCAIGFFQPGTFVLGGSHEETLYQEVMIEATCVKSLGARADWHKPDMGCRRRSFSF
jgi:hypothetical protein